MSTPQAARLFDLEKQLVAVLHDGSPRALNLNEGWLQIRPEVTVKQRIADLVLIHASREPNCKPAKLSYFEAAIVAFLLANGSADASTIAHALFSRVYSVATRAERLVRIGLVEIVGDELRVTDQSFASDVRIVAIEAKLSRWREAVKQAASYRTFANQSYIAMPADVFDRSADIWAACEGAGIGALAVRGDGGVDVIAIAPVVAPHSAEWVRLLSAAVGITQASNAFAQVD